MADFIDSAIEEGLKTPRRRRCHCQISQRPAKNAIRRRHLFAADDCALRFVRASAGESRISLPLRERRHRPASGHAGKNRAIARGHRDYWGQGILSNSCGIAADRAAEHRADLHHDVSWDQPHEGNMFEFLYKRRSIEMCKMSGRFTSFDHNPARQGSSSETGVGANGERRRTGARNRNRESSARHRSRNRCRRTCGTRSRILERRQSAMSFCLVQSVKTPPPAMSMPVCKSRAKAASTASSALAAAAAWTPRKAAIFC